MSALITSRWLNDDGTVNWNCSSKYQVSQLFSPVLPEFSSEEKLNCMKLQKKKAHCIGKKLVREIFFILSRSWTLKKARFDGKKLTWQH